MSQSSSDLYWWILAGHHASILVAAPTFKRAVELANSQYPRSGWGHDWRFDEPRPAELPGPPAAEGVYHWHAE